MRVSCLMPTYNRLLSERYGDCTWVVDEAVECFLRQTYEDKELIVCNDCPLHIYTCDAPDVTVINLPRRFRSLGEKMNFLAGIATGDVLVRWDDDDISLPHRLADQVARLQTTSNQGAARQPYEFVKPANFLYSERGRIVKAAGANHTVAAFRRALFVLASGYPLLTEYEDHIMDERLSEHGLTWIYDLPVSELWYIYRWSNRAEHLSGYTGGAGMGKDSWDGALSNKPLPGRHHIQPRWLEDYEAMVREFAETIA